MGEWSPFTLGDFEWEVLKLYLKYGYGDVKLYNTSFFTSSLTDETVCMTLQEFADKAVDYNGSSWRSNDAKGFGAWEDEE